MLRRGVALLSLVKVAVVIVKWRQKELGGGGIRTTSTLVLSQTFSPLVAEEGFQVECCCNTLVGSQGKQMTP